MLVSSNWMEAVPREVAKEDSLPLTRPSALDASMPPIDACGLTDVGLVRERNEDQFLVARLFRQMVLMGSSLPVPEDRHVLVGNPGHLFVVADGVGGHGGGDLASAVAVHAVTDAVLRSTPWVFEPGLLPDEAARDALVATELQAALARAEAQVHAVAERHHLVELRMATTLTLGLLLWPRLYVAHAGDSRCYVARAGQLRRVTRDHTLSEQVGVPNGAFKHVLVNAVGGADEKLMVEIHRVMLEPGDAVLFCTDGLTNQVSDEEIAAFLSQGGGAQLVCQTLIRRAKETGGRDNITVVVAQSGAGTTH